MRAVEEIPEPMADNRTASRLAYTAKGRKTCHIRGVTVTDTMTQSHTFTTAESLTAGRKMAKFAMYSFMAMRLKRRKPYQQRRKFWMTWETASLKSLITTTR